MGYLKPKCSSDFRSFTVPVVHIDTDLAQHFFTSMIEREPLFSVIVTDIDGVFFRIHLFILKARLELPLELIKHFPSLCDLNYFL